MKKIISFFLALIILTLTAVPCVAQTEEFDYIQYPQEAVTDFNSEILGRISSGDDYVPNRGYDETSLYISPYWSMIVNGSAVPVYASAVYDWVLDRGVLQSFQYLFIEEGSQLEIELTFLIGDVNNVSVLPESLECRASVNDNRINTHINKTGAYTFLINNDSQEYAVTVFVKENKNETAEIDGLKQKYGEDNVTVYEKGYYEFDTLPCDTDAAYFKRGAFVSFNHETDIRSDAEADSITPLPVMELNGKEDALISGCGTFDFTKLDRREKNLITVNFCKDTTVEGLVLINPNSWTVTAYACENCRFKDMTVFGYRTNSDGINICGCNNVKVENCFCRNGDDCFSAKATNTDYECHDVVFENCIGWSNKARCFGITGEVERDIYNISFSDCAVVFRNAVWNLDRTASLAVAVECGNGNVNNILFENVEIYKDTGRPVYCMVYGDGISNCEISNIAFRNIKINADEKIKISSQRDMNFIGKIFSFFGRILRKLNLKIPNFFSRFYIISNSVSAEFENVEMNGKNLGKSKIKHLINEGNTEIKFVS